MSSFAADGEEKPWGCKWFETWRANVRKAEAAGHTLVVVYFEGEVGQGKVAWADVAAQSRLRDGVLARKEAASTPAEQAAFTASL